MIREPWLIGQAFYCGQCVTLRSIRPDKLGVVAKFVIGPDMMKDENSFHIAGMRWQADGRNWGAS
ncbi:hypothetical protein ACCC88_05690 [Sphingomonas sp. Sphisp140]|uniref:hypothetical protein n=1 Tax=unclassified Sphingomonas TaxID=196159 RepID=UPI0039B07405